MMHKKNIFIALTWILIVNGALAETLKTLPMHSVFLKLEKNYQAQVGIYALDTNTNRIIKNRENEFFGFQSTFKLIAGAALMAKMPNVLNQEVLLLKKDLVPWAPISERYINKKVSYRTLVEAAITYSDNPAINGVIDKLGGLEAINKFARQLGNHSFKLKNYEANLNSNPKVLDDISTPKDMALSLQHLLFSDVLTDENKAYLKLWMRNNTTGYKRIRSGVPLGWVVVDKTGSGDYGIANDLGFVYSANCKPIILSIFTRKSEQGASYSDELVAQITRVTLAEFSKNNDCFKFSPT